MSITCTAVAPAIADQTSRSSSAAVTDLLSATSDRGDPILIHPAKLLFATSRANGVALFHEGGIATAPISFSELHALYPGLLMPIRPDCIVVRRRMRAVRSLLDNFGERHRYLQVDGHSKPLLVRRDYFEAVVQALDRVEPRD